MDLAYRQRQEREDEQIDESHGSGHGNGRVGMIKERHQDIPNPARTHSRAYGTGDISTRELNVGVPLSTPNGLFGCIYRTKQLGPACNKLCLSPNPQPVLRIPSFGSQTGSLTIQQLAEKNKSNPCGVEA